MNREANLKVLLNYILQTKFLDCSNRLKIKKYNQANANIVELMQKYISRYGVDDLLKSLLTHPEPIVRATVAHKFIMDVKLEKKELVNAFEIMKKSVEKLQGDIKIAFEMVLFSIREGNTKMYINDLKDLF